MKKKILPIVIFLILFIVPVSASITFNPYTNYVYLYRFNNSGHIYTNIAPATTSFDYFEDINDVNDSFLLRQSSVQHARNIKLNISTAYNAGSVEFAYEYLKSAPDNWVAFDNLNDGCVNLSVIGECYITYDMPTRWDNVNFDSKGAGTWARIRIVSTTSAPGDEGGAQGGTSLKGGDNCLYIVNEGNETNPVTWEDVYQEDLANGWNVIDKYGQSYYQGKYIGININVNSYMASESETFEWLMYDFDDNIRFNEYFDMYGTYRMGDVTDYGTYKEYAHGANLIFFGGYVARFPRGTGKVYAYDSILRGGGDGVEQQPSAWEIVGSVLDLERTNIENLKFSPGSDNVTLHDVYQYRYAQFYLYGQAGDIWNVDRMIVRDAGNAPYFSGAYSPDLELWNCDFRGNNNFVWYYRTKNASTINHVVPLDDPSMPNIWVLQGGVARAGELFDKYTLDITLVNSTGSYVQNANITIADAQGINYFNKTNSTGQISQQILTRRHFKGKADGSSGHDVYDMWDHNPHNITIETTDYGRVSFLYNISHQMDWVIGLMVGGGFLIIPSSSIIEPKNKKYPYSINLPLEYHIENATTCYYTLDGGKTNISINCNALKTKFDVDFDKNYTLDLYAVNENGTSSDSITFGVLRNKKGAMLWGAIIIALSSLSLFFFYSSKDLDNSKQVPLKLFLLGMAFIFINLVIRGSMLGIREYLKTPFLVNNFNTIYIVISLIMIILYILIFGYIIILTKKIALQQKDEGALSLNV